MNPKSVIPDVEAWTEDDLKRIPSAEDGHFEFKSSKVSGSIEKLKEKIQVAASAFWNSGGGVLTVGVDGQGRIDGGVAELIGRQTICDWVDQAIMMVQPPGPYVLRAIRGERAESLISVGNVVLVISFDESTAIPHMAPDGKYYLRAGAHSGPAGHFLVEAMYARRRLDSPSLRGLFRMSQGKRNTIELAVLALNEAPALSVQITLHPLPPCIAQDEKQTFPLCIPVIDRWHPFSMDIAYLHMADQYLGADAITLVLDYQDLAGRTFNDKQLLDYHASVSTLRIGVRDSDKIESALKEIACELKRLR